MYRNSGFRKCGLLIFFLIPIRASDLTQAVKNKYCTNLVADYVIVGIGNAGGLMANFLSADLVTSVIGLHDGDNLTNDPLIKFSVNDAITVPAAILPTDLYQNGPTVPQANLNNRQPFWTIPLPAGGGSSINAGAWSRQTPFINDEWEAIAGTSGLNQNLSREALAGFNWSNQNLLNIYISLEQYFGATENPAARGFNGPISVRQVQSPSVIAQKFTNAIATMPGTAVPAVIDYNNPNTPVCAASQFQYTQVPPSGDLRVSSINAFLNSSVITPSGQGVNGRKLQILFESLALNAIWSGNTVIGVKFSQNGVIKQVLANKGVIVCAGLKSSTFLMYSGIGPAPLLNNFNIPVIFDNPNVGQNLVDQPSVHIAFSSDPDDTQVPPLDPNSLFQSIAFFPDPNGSNPTRRVLRLATTNPLPGFVGCVFDLIQPTSRGSVSINSADPLQPPVVDPGYLSNNADLALLQRGLQITIKNLNTQLQNLYPDYELISPDPAILNDDAAVQDYIKSNLNPNFVYQGTCRMAALDNGGVVDSTGLVYGTKNLYVADNSVIPICIDGTTMATAYLVAANIANMIKAQL